MTASLAGFIEHTLLRADATPDDVARLCAEARDHGLFGVCVSPVYVERACRWAGDRVCVVTVAGFPLGTSTSASKAREAADAVTAGAREVDMVMALGAARAGDWAAVEADVHAVRVAIPGATLKVILETGHFDEATIVRAARASVDGGADFVKTSTGYGPRGASVDDVRILRAAVGDRARVKASGGIRTAEQARALVAAGATRIGTSSGVELSSG
jgi:deoxyribose-phosphate aldolase